MAVVLDLFSRKIVGWATQSTMHADLVLQALMMSVWRRKPPMGRLVQSDQGTQFIGHGWQDFLKAHGLVSSMSRRGNCHDGAVAESLFRLLKRERVKRRIYFAGEEAKPTSSTKSRCSTTPDDSTETKTGCIGRVRKVTIKMRLRVVYKRRGDSTLGGRPCPDQVTPLKGNHNGGARSSFLASAALACLGGVEVAFAPIASWICAAEPGCYRFARWWPRAGLPLV